MTTPAVVEAVELHRVRLPLRRPLRAAHGTLTERPLLFVRVVTDRAEGWGECAALPDRTYTEEDIDGAAAHIEGRLAPALMAGAPLDATDHPMATAAVRGAVLDAALRADGQSLADHLGAGGTRVAAGAVLGVQPSPGDAAAAAAELVVEGYRRLRVKIEPGRDIEALRAIRSAIGGDIQLLADANASYAGLDLAEVVDQLRPLEDMDLTALEQPLAADDLAGHAELAGRLDVPLGLDESLPSLDVLQRVLDLGAARVACIKVGHLGGLDVAREAVALCRDAGVDAFVGGMFDSCLGRSANAALATLPGFTIPGDVGPPAAYLAADVGDYPPLEGDGTVAVWQGPGVGPVPNLRV